MTRIIIQSEPDGSFDIETLNLDARLERLEEGWVLTIHDPLGNVAPRHANVTALPAGTIDWNEVMRAMEGEQ